MLLLRAAAVSLSLSHATASLARPPSHVASHARPGSNANAVDASPPRLVGAVANGQAYRAGAPVYEFWLLHLYGTPYEQGRAHGALLPARVRAMVNATWAYFKAQVEAQLGGLPAWLADLVAEVGLEAALDAFVDVTRNYTSPGIYEEMRGLADGAGVPLATVERIHMIGELTRGDCSLVGAWGAATAGGSVLTARALDW